MSDVCNVSHRCVKGQKVSKKVRLKRLKGKERRREVVELYLHYHRAKEKRHVSTWAPGASVGHLPGRTVRSNVTVRTLDFGGANPV